MSVPGWIIQVSACNLGAELEHEVVLFCQLNTPNALLPPPLLFHTAGWGQRGKKSLRIKTVSEH